MLTLRKRPLKWGHVIRLPILLAVLALAISNDSDTRSGKVLAVAILSVVYMLTHRRQPKERKVVSQ